MNYSRPPSIKKMIRRGSGSALAGRFLVPAVLMGLCLLIHTANGQSAPEIFVARTAAAALLPACQTARPPEACSRTLSIIAREITEAEPIPQLGPILEDLPDPLRSAVLFDREANTGECPLSQLADELRLAAERSASRGARGLAIQVSDQVADCFGMVISRQAPVTVIIWNDGIPQGWVRCLASIHGLSGCDLYIYPPRSAYAGVSYDLIGIDISLIKSTLLQLNDLYYLLYDLGPDRIKDEYTSHPPGSIHSFQSTIF